MIKTKVVSPEEIARMEKAACAGGCNEEEFMERAGSAVAAYAEQFILENGLERKVVLLTGKGNNGGDGYVAGRKLIEKGFSVEAFSTARPEALGALCLKQSQQFTNVGGKTRFVEEGMLSFEGGVIVDALVGTGFKGKAEGDLAKAITLANNSSLPIIAVDIPSGLSGSTGAVETVAIKADVTIYLEFPKIGFFIGKGMNHVGRLRKESFGLPEEYREALRPEAFLVGDGGMKHLLPPAQRTQNKYEAGYVVTLAGSSSMPGAGALSSLATLRSGAGIVRWFCFGENLPKCGFPEVITHLLQEDEDTFFRELKRARSLLVGPGLGRDKMGIKKIKKALEASSCATVIDGDALFFLAEHPSFPIPENSIVTPHLGELKRLLDAHKLHKGFFKDAQAFADKKKVTLLVKGAPNFLFAKGEVPLIMPFGNPGMATAGSGDALAGVLAGLLARRLKVVDAAVFGCFIHGLAGDIGVSEKTEYCLIASDILDSLPKAFKKVLERD